MRFWYNKSKLSYLLLPAACVYCFGNWLHKTLYKLNIKKTIKPPVPVIVVGNITVGGTGKSPFVVRLYSILVEMGFKPGIVSRGYGGTASSYPCVVTASSNPNIVGDEPVMLAKQCVDAPVVVSPQRAEAIKTCIEKFAVDIIISDDGLQHYAMKPTIEIVIIDGKRKLGNGFCLPAGPLRESKRRLDKVDLIAEQSEASQALHFYLAPKQFRHISNNEVLPLDAFDRQSVHAVAGIGNPDRFFNELKKLNINCIESALDDHHQYTLSDFAFDDALPVIMTAKDAVKCCDFKLKRSIYQLEVDVVFSDSLLKKLQSILARKLRRRS